MMYDYAPVIREGKIVCLVTQLRLKSLSGNDCKAECVTIGWELTQTSNLQYWREKITIRPIDEISSIKTSCLKNNQNFNLFIVPWSIKCGGEKQRSGRSLSGSTESSLAMGARRNFSRGGKTARTDKNDLFCGAPKARTKIFAIFSAL